jgi:hypothetical protein
MDASARDERSLPDEALSIVARGLWPRIRRAYCCRTGAMPHDLGTRQAVFELRRPLATRSMQKRIHGLS